MTRIPNTHPENCTQQNSALVVFRCDFAPTLDIMAGAALRDSGKAEWTRLFCVLSPSTPTLLPTLINKCQIQKEPQHLGYWEVPGIPLEAAGTGQCEL